MLNFNILQRENNPESVICWMSAWRARRTHFLWKGEVVIIACGGACLGAAEDQNSLLRDAALHVRARTCPSTITHTLGGCFSRVGSVVCSGFLGTPDLLYLIKETHVNTCRQPYPVFFWGGGIKKLVTIFTIPPFYSLVAAISAVVFPIFLSAVMRCCHVSPGPFLALNHY